MATKKWLAATTAAAALCLVSQDASAQAVNFGTDCPGFSGTVPTISVPVPGAIVAGTPFTINITGLPDAAGPTRLIIGTSNTLWGAVPLPLDLGVATAYWPSGTGCFLNVANNSKAPFALDSNGDASFTITLGGVGLTGYVQAFIFDYDTLPVPTYVGGLSEGLRITSVAPSGNTGGELVITEFMSNPTIPGDDGEWVEIYNPGVSAIDIEGWILGDLDFDAHVIDVGGAGLMVAAGGYVVLGNNADMVTNGGVPVDYEYEGTFGMPGFFGMSNSGFDEVVLYDFAGVVIDSVVFTGGWPLDEGRSTSLVSPCLDATCNDSSLNWCSSDDVLTGGDYGTPGAANGACAPIVTCGAGVSDTFPTDGPLAGTTPAMGCDWTAHSGAGNLPIMVSGGQAVLTHGSGSREDCNSEFIPYSSGTLTATFDMSVDDTGGVIAGTDMEYFISFGATGGASSLLGRVDVVPPGSPLYGVRDYTLGIATNGGTAEFSWGTDLTFGVSASVTLTYDLGTDQASLSVNGGTAITTTSAGGSGSTVIDDISLRQSTSTNSETIRIDNLTVTHTP